jgi:phage terminase large subunit
MSLGLDLSLDTLITWKRKPHAMVEDLFGVKPDPSQREALEAFPHSPRIAMKACTGSGKTATLAWLGLNFLLTRPHPMIGAASISHPNLKSNLWPELARWFDKHPLFFTKFRRTDTSIYNPEHAATWRIEARAWSQDANQEQVGNALAGLHSDYVMWLLYESGGYPLAVMPVCEAIFSGSPKEAHIVQAGNPTHLTGPLYEACTRARRFWKVIEINRRSRLSQPHRPRLDRTRSSADRGLRPRQPVGQGARVRRVPAVLA